MDGINSPGELALSLPKSLEWDARALPGFVCSTLPGARPAEVGEIGRLGRVRIFLMEDPEFEEGRFRFPLTSYPDLGESVELAVAPSGW